MTHSIISLGKAFPLDSLQRAAVSPVGSVGASKCLRPFEVATGDPHLCTLAPGKLSSRTAHPAFSVGHFDPLISLRSESGCHLGNLIFNDIEALRKNNVVNLTTLFSGNWEINVLPFSLHGFPAPFRRRFPALLLRVIAGYPMQTVMRFSRCGAGFGNKKSPHNNLNLTIPSGMALVRVCYVAIRKLKTCSGSFGSRAGTLSKYVILNCWSRLPQKSSRVNKKF